MARHIAWHQTKIQFAHAGVHHRNSFFNQKFNEHQMKLKAEDYLNNAKDSAALMYRDDTAQNRLAFHVGILEGYIIQMVNIINVQNEALEIFKNSMMEKK
ncbi:hypothetical protein UFOVP259_14 [uncultured Caudovirales phage]|uniref:Uncharacterized protein n=1 Tax=uncultured Caudovirales phage TaxID=2100421 RepID=A0A6J5LCS6_9CAUD|nr:hypothetical protein UFOVP259_14 [uncultured Caudovirales phage]